MAGYLIGLDYGTESARGIQLNGGTGTAFRWRILP
jgi:hypothetical protein